MRLASGCEDCARWPGGVCNDCANRSRAALADAVLAIVEREAKAGDDEDRLMCRAILAEAEDKEE